MDSAKHSQVIEEYLLPLYQSQKSGELLTAVNLAALTIYDMCKAVDKKMRITNVKLVSKTKK